MYFLEVTLKLLIPGVKKKTKLAEAISNTPVPSQLSGKIHVMLYLQTLSVDDSLDAQLDSNDQEKRKDFTVVDRHKQCTISLTA